MSEEPQVIIDLRLRVHRAAELDADPRNIAGNRRVGAFVTAVLEEYERVKAEKDCAQAEVRRLRSLLVRYADHVGECEGTWFLGYPSNRITERDAEEIRAMLERYEAGEEP